MTSKMFYLCQHGDALASDVDPDRPLSDQGKTDVANTADSLSGRVGIQAIFHSGKTRARQTAQIFHDRLAPESTIEPDTGLGPNDSVEDFIRRFGGREASVMIVSHLPFVGRLASRLLGHRDRDILVFQPGTVAALTSRTEGGEWMLAWMLTPGLLSK